MAIVATQEHGILHCKKAIVATSIKYYRAKRRLSPRAWNSKVQKGNCIMMLLVIMITIMKMITTKIFMRISMMMTMTLLLRLLLLLNLFIYIFFEAPLLYASEYLRAPQSAATLPSFLHF